MKLLILKGLPASGKSTYAKELAQKPEWKRVNRDLMREMIDGGKWNQRNEKLIRLMEVQLAETLLVNDFNVVVDDTNLSPEQENMWLEMARDYNERWDKKIEWEEKFFDITVEEAIKRDLARPISVGEKVIKKMYNSYLRPPVRPYKAAEGTPKAIVVDIDGTAAHMAQRGPYDFTQYHTDTADPTVNDIVNRYYEDGYEIIFCSGRDDTYHDVTKQWLVDNEFPCDELFMRKAGDKRNDAIVKRELFEEHIAPHYNVKFVLDDRDRVVEMWRELGLKVLQVAEGDF